jgi:hypothetical protein
LPRLVDGLDVDGRGALSLLIAQVVAVGADAQRCDLLHDKRRRFMSAMPAAERLDRRPVARRGALGAAHGEQVLSETVEPQASM